MKILKKLETYIMVNEVQIMSGGYSNGVPPSFS